MPFQCWLIIILNRMVQRSHGRGTAVIFFQPYYIGDKMRLHRFTNPKVFSLALLAAVGMGGGAIAAAPNPETTTPIKHLVVLFQESVSFDHYFATFP